MSQLLIWLSLTSIDQVNASFLFFNDGDLTPDKDKIIGNTGGFYNCIEGEYFNKIIKTIQNGISKGYRGDCSGNNIEVLIRLQTKNPNAK